jgi:hypothetical protein
MVHLVVDTNWWTGNNLIFVLFVVVGVVFFFVRFASLLLLCVHPYAQIQQQLQQQSEMQYPKCTCMFFARLYIINNIILYKQGYKHWHLFGVLKRDSVQSRYWLWQLTALARLAFQVAVDYDLCFCVLHRQWRPGVTSGRQKETRVANDGKVFAFSNYAQFFVPVQLILIINFCAQNFFNNYHYTRNKISVLMDPEWSDRTNLPFWVHFCWKKNENFVSAPPYLRVKLFKLINSIENLCV